MEQEQKEYPLAIIGAGPAGLSASIYASRYGVRHVVIGHLLGGQISETHAIGNYPGIGEIGGFEFGESLVSHARGYGATIENRMVSRVSREGDGFSLLLDGGSVIRSGVILLAVGTNYRPLGLARESEFLGKGVSSCATCDGFFYKGKVVTVVGGSNSAVGSAVYLADIAAKVYVIYRGKELRAEEHLLEILKEKPNVEIVYGTNIVSLVGKDSLSAVTIDTPHDGSDTIPTDGLFIEIGSDPNADFARDLGAETDEHGYVKVGPDMSTSVPGVFAAGDITDGSDGFRQVVTAVSEGAIAARSIHAALGKRK